MPFLYRIFLLQNKMLRNFTGWLITGFEQERRGKTILLRTRAAVATVNIGG